MKRVSFKTVGCRLNQAETAAMAARLAEAGYTVVPYGAPCDVCVVHSCAVTSKAERDSIRYARTCRKYGPRTVVLAGCLAEIAGVQVQKLANADVLATQRNKFDLPRLLGEPWESPQNNAPPTNLFQSVRAAVKVQDGCDFGCAFCVVPAARGRSRSIPASRILDEIRRLAEAGFREVTLTGANLGCYSDNGKGLAGLLEEVEQIQGIARIRLSSIEVSTVERAVVDHMAHSQKLCRYLHLPLQSGDDSVLAAMRRRYAAANYRRFVEYAVARLPTLGLGADVIVGFPGEDSRAFENTVRLVQELPFSNLHVFPYNRRPSTPAWVLPDTVPESEKKRRVRVFLTLKREKTRAFAQKWIGATASVLVERVDKQGTGYGWTGEYLRAKIQPAGDSAAGPLEVNRIVNFRPTGYDGTMLF